MISEKLKIKIKLGKEPAYRVAQRAGLDATVLSKLINGYYKVERGDPRVVAIGKILNIPEVECFQEDVG